MNDTDTVTYRTATHDEKQNMNIPTYLWMGVASDDDVRPTAVVGAATYQDAYMQNENLRSGIAAAASWLETFANENDLIIDGNEKALISLEQINGLLEMLGRDPITGVTEYSFGATITYTVEGTVLAADEDRANQLIEDLLLSMGEPEINEPGLNEDCGEEWGDVYTEYSEHSIEALDEL